VVDHGEYSSVSVLCGIIVRQFSLAGWRYRWRSLAGAAHPGWCAGRTPAVITDEAIFGLQVRDQLDHLTACLQITVEQPVAYICPFPDINNQYRPSSLTSPQNPFLVVRAVVNQLISRLRLPQPVEVQFLEVIGALELAACLGAS